MPSGLAGTARSSRRSWAFVAAIVFGIATRHAGAQSYAAPAGGGKGQGLEAGHLYFYPSLLVNYGYDSNVFYSSGNTSTDQLVSSRLTVLQPRLMFDMPMAENWIRWTYQPVYRNYSTSAFTQPEPWSHFFDMDGRLRFGTRGYTAFRDHFVRGSQELREIDPGGELTFGLVPFRTHEPLVEVGMELGARQAVSVLWNYQSTQFKDPEVNGLYNFRGHGFEGRYNWQLSPVTKTYAFYHRDTTVQARGAGVNVDTMTTGIGLVKTVNRSVTAEIIAAYEEMAFTGAAPSNYAGPTISVTTSWQIDDVTRVAFAGRRQPYQSYYLNNNFYLNRDLATSFTRQVGGTMYWTIGVGFENNVYSDPLDTSLDPGLCVPDGQGGQTCPSEGVLRKDRGWRLQAGLGFQMGRSARGFLDYNYQVRSSNVLEAFPDGFSDPFDYTVNRLMFRIEVGLL